MIPATWRAVLVLVFLGLMELQDPGDPPESLERHEYRARVMGTEARIVLFAAEAGQARQGAQDALRRIRDLEERMTDWRAESELVQLSSAPAHVPIRLSADLFDVLERSRILAAETGGAFDFTLGALTSLWRERKSEGRLPAPHELEEARRRTGWEQVVLDRATSSVRFECAGMRLDLGAIGKGYACDEALEVLRSLGIDRALVEIGGDLVVGDAPPGEAGWRISAGCAGGELPDEILTLENAAVATSGDTEQSLEIGGARHSHILDPNTGASLVDAPCVSVVAPDAAGADALASAVSVLGARRGRALLARRAGTRLLVQSRGFRALFDGESLAGWRTLDSPQALEAGWSAEGGVLAPRVNAKGPSTLITEASYSDFVLELEASATEPDEWGVVLGTSADGTGTRVSFDAPVHESARGFTEPWYHVEIHCSAGGVRAWVNGEPYAPRIRGALVPGTKGPIGLFATPATRLRRLHLSEL